MSEAEEGVGLRAELTGALGKRTRYQVKELAQLMLAVTTAPGRRDGEMNTTGEEGEYNTEAASVIRHCV